MSVYSAGLPTESRGRPARRGRHVAKWRQHLLRADQRQPDDRSLAHQVPADIPASIALIPAFKILHICSKVGGWGDWKSVIFCNNGFITGFQLKVEGSHFFFFWYNYTLKIRVIFAEDQRGGDDTATNSMRVKCSGGQELEGDGWLQ